MRKITNDDLWSAIRGCKMTSLSREEVQQLVEAHRDSSMFAGQVIAEAARQVLAGRLYRKEKSDEQAG